MVRGNQSGREPQEKEGLMLETVKKVGVSKIVITRAEGLTKLCGKPHMYSSWELAKYGLARDNSTYPGMNQGYDKHDFVVYFEDGETYSGRLDVKQLICGDNDQDVKKHVNEFMSFYAGIFKPGWMSLENYEKALSDVNREEYLEFLRKYDV